MIYDNTPDFYHQQAELARQYARQRREAVDLSVRAWMAAGQHRAAATSNDGQQDLFAGQKQVNKSEGAQ